MEIVDEVVSCLTGPEGDSTASKESLRKQMELAAEEFETPTVQTVVQELLERLTEDPNNTRELEALLILGLAHAPVLDRYREQMITEGRRLALLLEHGDNVERSQALLEVLAARLPQERSIQHDLASLMRRTGNSDRLIERYVRHAEDGMERGSVSDAIAWLQEALVLDGTRRDVARMIRDLRFQEDQKRRRRARRLQLFGVSVGLVLMMVGVVHRERIVQEDYQRLPPASEADIAALETRLRAIDAFIASKKVWLGMFEVREERVRLVNKIDAQSARLAERDRQAKAAAEMNAALADATRTRARDLVQQKDLAGALEAFEKALELAPADWPHLERTRADAVAVREYLDELAAQEGPVSEPTEDVPGQVDDSAPSEEGTPPATPDEGASQ